MIGNNEKPAIIVVKECNSSVFDTIGRLTCKVAVVLVMGVVVTSIHESWVESKKKQNNKKTRKPKEAEENN